MKKTVLIIEDHPDDFDFLKDFLGTKGYNILPKKSDLNAMFNAFDPNSSRGDIESFVINYLKKNYNNIGLILCDIKFEGTNDEGGKELVERIRKSSEYDPSYWAFMVPIIAVTNYSSNQDSILDAGANCLFRKEAILKDPDYFRSECDRLLKKFMNHFEITRHPEDIAKNIIRFTRKQHRTTAFIMTSFNHLDLANNVCDILSKHNIDGFIANHEGGLNTDLLLPNIRTFIHGCDFGIGIFADDSGISTNIQTKDTKIIRINPNLCLEVGYMLGLQKKVCFLKSHTLDKMNTDLAERVFVSFDDKNLETKLVAWLRNKHFI